MTNNPWEDKWLVEQRKYYLSLGIYEEIEGCQICFNQIYDRWRTMKWPLIPKKKCSKHPRYNLKRALFQIDKSKEIEKQ